MTSASLILTGALLFGPPNSERPTPVLTPTQPQPGEPAIAPAHVDSERAGPEPMPAQPIEPEPVTTTEPEPAPEDDPAELPSWQEGPTPPEESGEPTSIAGWDTPIDPEVVKASRQAPPKGMALFAPAIGVFGLMITTQLITGLTCDPDVYCGTRGWPWRGLGIGTMALAGGGGWLQGKRVAWDRDQDELPAKNPIGRRAAGWAMFVVGLGGLVADTALYQLCYDGKRGPYMEVTGFRYTCSPVVSVVVLDFSTLIGAGGLGLALSAESQLRHQKKFALSVAPWGGRGQAGLSIAGRF
jgi:hypothetical protein